MPGESTALGWSFTMCSPGQFAIAGIAEMARTPSLDRASCGTASVGTTTSLRLEPKGSLRLRPWLHMDPLQLEHADLDRRAARRGESTHRVPGGQHPVAGDDQWNRIPGHGLTDIARHFGSGAEFLRDGAVGRRVAPCDVPDRSVNSP